MGPTIRLLAFLESQKHMDPFGDIEGNQTVVTQILQTR